MRRDAFIFLVKTELRRWFKKGSIGKRFLYLPIGTILFVFALLTYFVIQGTFNVAALLYVTFGFPYMVVGMNYHIVQRERKNGTTGWWLTLPYPRSWLLGAKFIAGLLQAVVIYLVAFVLLLLIDLNVMALQGGFNSAAFAILVQTALAWFVVVVAITPFFTAYGILAAVTRYSRLRILGPLMWIVFGCSASFWAQLLTNDQIGAKPDLGKVDFFIHVDWSARLGFTVLLSLALTYVLFFFATKLLSRIVKF